MHSRPEMYSPNWAVHRLSEDEHQAVACPSPHLSPTSCPASPALTRYLGDETFQREIMVSPINATKSESLLWIVERQV